MSRKFEAIISILDKASLPLMSIEEKMRNLGTRAKKTEVEIKEIGATSLMKSRIGQDLHAIGSKISHVGHAIHHHLEGPMEKVGASVEKIVEAVPVLGALGGIGSLAGFVEGIRNTAELSEKLKNLSVVSGISVPKLQELQFAAKDTGISTDELARGMGRLNERLGKAAIGQNKQLAAVFDRLHISLRNADGSVKSASQQLPVLMQALHDTHNPAMRATLAMEAFGRTGVDLIPFLKLGSAKLLELNERFKKYGEVFSQSDQSGLEKFTHSWNDLELAVGGVVQKFSAALAPAIAPVLKDFAGWIALEGRLISPRLKADLSWLELKISNFDWTKFEASGGKAFKEVEGAASALWAVMKPIIEGIEALQAVHKWERKTLAPVNHIIYGAPLTGIGSLPKELRPKGSGLVPSRSAAAVPFLPSASGGRGDMPSAAYRFPGMTNQPPQPSASPYAVRPSVAAPVSPYAVRNSPAQSGSPVPVKITSCLPILIRRFP